MDYKNEYKLFDDYALIYLNNGLECKVSLCDFHKAITFDHKWYGRYNKTNDAYYATASCKPSTVQLHRYILGLEIISGERSKYHVDHINHDTLDNRRDNMRVTSSGNNSRSRKGKNSNNTSGYRNVCKINDKWVVQLQVDGKNTKLGRFDDVDEAGAYAKEMRKKYYGEFNGN